MAAFDPTKIRPDAPLRLGERSPTGCDYFDYAPGQPNLHLLMCLKLFLVPEHGIAAAFDRYRRTIPRHGDAKLILRELQGLYAFSSTRAEEFAEIEPAGKRFTVTPPVVIGHGNHRPLRNTARSFYLACLRDALVRGRSSVIEVAGTALLDYEGDELDRIDDQVEFDAAVFHRDNKRIWMISEDDSKAAMRLNSAVSLLGARTDFFGDWLCDYFLKYVASLHSRILRPVPILIDADMPKTHRQAIELVLRDRTEIIEVPAFEPVHVRHLWCMPSLGYMPVHQRVNARFKWDYLSSAPDRFPSLQRDMLHRVDRRLGPARGPSRIFLARKDFRHRRLVNRVEIEAVAEKRGFAVVYPEDLSFAEQVRLLRGARFIMGPEGSAFFLALYFRNPGTKLCILSHPVTEALSLYNAGCAPGELTIVTGPLVKQHHENAQDSDYVIDAAVLDRFLQEWLVDEEVAISA